MLVSLAHKISAGYGGDRDVLLHRVLSAGTEASSVLLLCHVLGYALNPKDRWVTRGGHAFSRRQ